MSRPVITTGVEYALYWLAVNAPDVLDEAAQHTGGMLVANPAAYRDAENLLDRHNAAVAGRAA